MSMAERPIFGNGLIHVPKAALKSDLRYLTPVSTGIINYYNMDKKVTIIRCEMCKKEGGL